MKEGDRTFKAIMNYVVLRLQEFLKDEYVLHKKSIKFLKNKKYKDAKGTGSQKVQEFVLPKEFNIDEFKRVKKKIIQEQYAK